MSRYGDVAENTGNAENRRCSRQRVLGGIAEGSRKALPHRRKRRDAGGARLTIDYAVMLIAEQIVIDRMMSETLGGATHNGRSDYHN